jgi:hypothetical protein
MACAASKYWISPKFSRLLLLFLRTATSVLLITIGAIAFLASPQDVELPDYFASPRSERESLKSVGSDQELTESDAESVISLADDALRQLAHGNTSAALSFAALFGASVDYYDEGVQTPAQIAREKTDIFGSYRNYSTKLIGRPMLQNTDRPNVKWVSFTYQYEITKKSGVTLRGVAEARWELRKAGNKIFVIATRETTHRQ